MEARKRPNEANTHRKEPEPGGKLDTSSNGDNDYDNMQRKIYLKVIEQFPFIVEKKFGQVPGGTYSIIAFPYGYQGPYCNNVISFILSRIDYHRMCMETLR